MSEDSTEIEQAGRMLGQARSLLVITGAGISAESGVPTFRGPDGLYSQRPELSQTLSADGLARDPYAVWDHLNQMRIRLAEVKPNSAHETLARWEREGRFSDFLIATQNIDGLHQAAGSDRVTELHGSAWQVARSRETDYAGDAGFSDDFRDFLTGANKEALLRKWSQENDRDVWENREVPFREIPPYADDRVRPNVVFFDELYGNRLLWVHAFIERKPDAVLVVGCSCSVRIVETLLGLCLRANPRCQIINVNNSESGIPFDHVDIRLMATSAMERLDRFLS